MKWLPNLLRELARRLPPKPDQSRQLSEAARRERFLTQKLAELAEQESLRDADRAFHSMVDDLIEARAMAGTGPWKCGPAALKQTDELIERLKSGVRVRETDSPINNQGAFGDIELALQNVDWRREINFSVLQFSRWGIQQIILILRLYYIKNPIVRSLIDVCAAYIFARGVEVTTNDERANETLKEFFEDNRDVFGQVALVQSEREKDTDGNLFWCLFRDQVDTGKVKCRKIDATEVQEIVTNPDDASEEWLFLRIWQQSTFSIPDGQTTTVTRQAWYPALGYDPDEKPDTIRDYPVLWKTATHHRKVGFVGKWTMGCPRAYPMTSWAKEATRYLEATAQVAQQLAQVSLVLTTKGGQQALMGAKAQLGTTEGPSAALWDSNPPAVAGAVFGSGTGTKLEAFKTQGAGIEPKNVAWYMRMCCMVPGVPSSFIGDVEDSNRAVATSLDRPTETRLLEKQESWVEDLYIIAKVVLETSAAAPSGKLSEAKRHGALPLRISECKRKKGTKGVIYEAFSKDPDGIEIQVNFPAIREGDIPALVDATIKAGTLGNTSGQFVGLDEKATVRKLYELVGIEDGDELTEAMYPEATYEADRTLDQDIPSNIAATVESMTLGNRHGDIVGIDEKFGVTKLMMQNGMPEAEARALADKMYPNREYDPDRTQEPAPIPAEAAPPIPGQQPGPVSAKSGETAEPAPDPNRVQEALARVAEAVAPFKRGAGGRPV